MLFLSRHHLWQLLILPWVHAFVIASTPGLTAISAMSVRKVLEDKQRITEDPLMCSRCTTVSTRVKEKDLHPLPVHLCLDQCHECYLAGPACHPGNGPAPCGRNPGNDPDGQSRNDHNGRPLPCAYQANHLSLNSRKKSMDTAKVVTSLTFWSNRRTEVHTLTDGDSSIKKQTISYLGRIIPVS